MGVAGSPVVPAVQAPGDAARETWVSGVGGVEEPWIYGDRDVPAPP